MFKQENLFIKYSINRVYDKINNKVRRDEQLIGWSNNDRRYVPNDQAPKKQPKFMSMSLFVL